MKFRTILILAISVTAIIGVGIGVNAPIDRLATPPLEIQKQQRTLTVGDATVALEVADTSMVRGRGLSGRRQLDRGTGMLFVFERNDVWSFWMKDMYFPIDMIWFDDQYRVVFIEQNATPESYPAAFTPTSAARYVLEVNAGFARVHGIGVGDQATLTLGNGIR